MKYIAAFVCTLAVVAHAAAKLDPITAKLISDASSMADFTADPCSDFYQYACGSFVKNHPAPQTNEPYFYDPSFNNVSIVNDEKLKEIMAQPWPLISEFYESCMQPVDILAEPDIAKTYYEISAHIRKHDLAKPKEFVELTQYLAFRGIFAGVYTLEINFNGVDELYVVPALALLANYSEINPEFIEYKTDLIEFLTKYGDASRAKEDADAIIQIEKDFSPSTNDVKNITIDQASEQSGFNFTHFFLAGHVKVHPMSDYIELIDLAVFTNLTKAPARYGSEIMYKLYEWHAFVTLSEYNISSCIESSSPSQLCAQIVGGDIPFPPPLTQAQFCRYTTQTLLNDLVDLVFSTIVVTPEVYNDIRTMTLNIQGAFNASLDSLSWLDDNSTESVRFKLANVLQIIGHSPDLERYEHLRLSPYLFSKNLLDVIENTASRQLNEFFNPPANRTDDPVDSELVNAYYDPTKNTITFPAGILESPMFSGSWPKLFQYARLGYVVGHETTHGFDNQGSQWNAFGQNIDIFDNATITKFNERTQCVANYYSTFIQYNTTHVDGQVTLGENIADIGGVKNSYRAYQQWVEVHGKEFEDGTLIPGLSTNQVFFLTLGQTWCASVNTAYLAFQYANDVHSPAPVRVNGPLSQFDQFAAEFHCPAKSPMNPADRCLVW